jgi:hypothetical protein
MNLQVWNAPSNSPSNRRSKQNRRHDDPRDYTAGIDCSKQPTQKSRLGEPHECYSLYRIGRTQENYQLLHQNGSRPDRERGHAGRRAFCVAYFGFVLSAIHQPVLTFVGTVHGSSLSQYTLSSVLKSAGLLSLNLRGRGFTVPANGCLATLLLRWQCVRSRTVLNRIPQIAWGKPFHQVKGNLRFPLTVTYHGCPERPERRVPKDARYHQVRSAGRPCSRASVVEKLRAAWVR